VLFFRAPDKHAYIDFFLTNNATFLHQTPTELPLIRIVLIIMIGNSIGFGDGKRIFEMSVTMLSGALLFVN